MLTWALHDRWLIWDSDEGRSAWLVALLRVSAAASLDASSVSLDENMLSYGVGRASLRMAAAPTAEPRGLPR